MQSTQSVCTDEQWHLELQSSTVADTAVECYGRLGISGTVVAQKYGSEPLTRFRWVQSAEIYRSGAHHQSSALDKKSRARVSASTILQVVCCDRVSESDVAVLHQRFLFFQ